MLLKYWIYKSFGTRRGWSLWEVIKTSLRGINERYRSGNRLTPTIICATKKKKKNWSRVSAESLFASHVTWPQWADSHRVSAALIMALGSVSNRGRGRRPTGGKAFIILFLPDTGAGVSSSRGWQSALSNFFLLLTSRLVGVGLWENKIKRWLAGPLIQCAFSTLKHVMWGYNSHFLHASYSIIHT